MNRNSWRALIRKISGFGGGASDEQGLRLQKSLLVVGSIVSTFAAFVWGIIYIILNEPVAGLIPLFYAVISCVSLIYLNHSHNYRLHRDSQLVLILLLPFLLQIALGGFINSSAVIVWAFICPMSAILFAGYKQAPYWLLAFLGALVVSGLIQPFMPASNRLSQGVVTLFFVLNIGAISALVFSLLYYFVRQRELDYKMLAFEQDRSESLLLNVLPEEIAERLKSGESEVADQYPSVSILFADLVGFTPLSSQLSPNEMVQLLNRIYSYFDSLIEKYGVEKIRTIGDNYMVAAGVPSPRNDHAQALAQLALDMTQYINSLEPVAGKRLAFRIGINSGPAIAGVIGYKKFAYDVWGDTVNVASRMESQGTPGRIQITQQTYELLKNDFVCESNGSMIVKGKGAMDTWFLVAPNRDESKMNEHAQPANELEIHIHPI